MMEKCDPGKGFHLVTWHMTQKKQSIEIKHNFTII